MPVQVFAIPALQSAMQLFASDAAHPSAGAAALVQVSGVPAAVTLPPTFQSAATIPLDALMGRSLPASSSAANAAAVAAAASAAAAATATAAAAGDAAAAAAGSRMLLYSALARVPLAGAELDAALDARRTAASLRQQERGARAAQRALDRAKALAHEEALADALAEQEELEGGAAASSSAAVTAAAALAARAAALAAECDPLTVLDAGALGLSRSTSNFSYLSYLSFLK